MGSKREQMIEEFYTVLDQWMTLYEENDNRVEQILLAGQYSNVALYGMGAMGWHFIRALKGSEIQIKYIIDQVHREYCDGIHTVTLDEVSGDFDAVIYTNPFEKEYVAANVGEKYDIPVIYLGDLVFGNL